MRRTLQLLQLKLTCQREGHPKGASESGNAQVETIHVGTSAVMMTGSGWCCGRKATQGASRWKTMGEWR